MSLVTRCPACSIRFKIVPDQIRIAAGWVRCGRCGEVFEASLHLRRYDDHASTTSQPQQPKPQPPQPQPQPQTQSQQQSQPHPVAAPETHAAPQPAAAAPAQPAVMSSQAGRAAVLAKELQSVKARMARQAALAQAPAPAPAPSPAPATPAPAPPEARVKASSPALLVDLDSIQFEDAPLDSLNEWAEPDADGEAGADQPAPSFVAQVERRAFWSSRPARVLSSLALLLLLLLLAVQVVVNQRDWLAARASRLTPVLRALCAPLRCSVQPYRYLDAIVIDSSAFNRAADGSFRLSVTLHNTADMPVASPALELTLTDAQDQPLVRRVLTAAELHEPPALAARGEFSHTSTLTVNGAVNPGAIVNYRLAAFYP